MRAILFVRPDYSSRCVSLKESPLKLVPILKRPESGKKEEPKPKLLGPDILWWGGGLPREGVGAEKFGMFLETRVTKFFSGLCRDIPEVPGKSEKKTFLFNFPFLWNTNRANLYENEMV